MPTGEGVVWNLVVIGDSSLWELGDALAKQIQKDVGVEVVLKDFALPTLSAGIVLEQLETGQSANYNLKGLNDAVKEAEVVVLFINPNDSIDPKKPLDMEGCFGISMPKSCEMETFAKYTEDMTAIWAKIIELRAGQPTILRGTDLYNPLVDQWNRNGTFEACSACWEHLSDAARQAAEAYHIPFLSRYDSFNGEAHLDDPGEKGYIRSDGLHPTALACEFTAELLSEMGYEPVIISE